MCLPWCHSTLNDRGATPILTFPRQGGRDFTYPGQPVKGEGIFDSTLQLPRAGEVPAFAGTTELGVAFRFRSFGRWGGRGRPMCLPWCRKGNHLIWNSTLNGRGATPILTFPRQGGRDIRLDFAIAPCWRGSRLRGNDGNWGSVSFRVVWTLER